MYALHLLCFMAYRTTNIIFIVIKSRLFSAVAIDRVLFCFGVWLIERGIKYLKCGSCGLWLTERGMLPGMLHLKSCCFGIRLKTL